MVALRTVSSDDHSFELTVQARPSYNPLIQFPARPSVERAPREAAPLTLWCERVEVEQSGFHGCLSRKRIGSSAVAPHKSQR